ncbi:MAG: hypothetical protein SGILL_000078 [Bacillariaceae sp.]
MEQVEDEIEIEFCPEDGTCEDEDCIESSDDENEAFTPKFDRSEIVGALFPKGHPDGDMPTRVDDDDLSDEEDEEREKFKPQFERSEIISALFPQGYPDEKRGARIKPRPSTSRSVERINSLRRFLQKRKNAYSVNSMVLQVQSDLGSVESSVQEPSTVDSSDTTTATPSHDTRRTESTCLKKGKDGNCYSAKFTEGESANIIGMLITWDPTWELLEPHENQCRVPMPKSRLKKLQDVDVSDECLLGDFGEDASSVDSRQRVLF